MSQPATMYGSEAAPVPPVTPFAAVKSAFPLIIIGACDEDVRELVDCFTSGLSWKLQGAEALAGIVFRLGSAVRVESRIRNTATTIFLRDIPLEGEDGNLAESTLI